MAGMKWRSSHFDLASLLSTTLAVVFENEGHAVPFVEWSKAGTLECRGMDEHVGPTRLRGDETVAFGGIEELYSSIDAIHFVDLPKRICVQADRVDRQLRKSGKANEAGLGAREFSAENLES